MPVRVIQFSHPGRQLNIEPTSDSRTDRYDFYEGDSECGVRYWNRYSSHFRKFIRAEGFAVSKLNGKPSGKDLLFWGEYEPLSEFKYLNAGSNVEQPEAIHYPLRVNEPDVETYFNNTDPFIWSEQYYNNCKQRSYSYLRDLDPGSIIIFGTEYDPYYVIDHVFVVGEVEGNLVEYFDNPKDKMVDWYYDMSFSRTKAFYEGLMSNPDTSTRTLNAIPDMKYYMAKTINSTTPRKERSLFSFSPARTYEENKSGFKRLTVNAEDPVWGMQNPGAGTVCWRVVDDNGNRIETLEGAKAYWEKLAKHCLSEDYIMATKMKSSLPNSLNKPNRLIEW